MVSAFEIFFTINVLYKFPTYVITARVSIGSTVCTSQTDFTLAGAIIYRK